MCTLKQVFLASSLTLDTKSVQSLGTVGAGALREQKSPLRKTDKLSVLVSSLSNTFKGNRLISAPRDAFFSPKYWCCFCSKGRYWIPCQWMGRRSVKAEIKEGRKHREKPSWSRGKTCLGPTYQISVDDTVLFQISHSFTHILAHSQQGFLWKTAPLAPEVVRQAPILHELKHQANRSVLKAHAVKLDELGVRQLPVGRGGKVEEEAEIGSVPSVLMAHVLYTAACVTLLHLALQRPTMKAVRRICVDQVSHQIALLMIPF